MKKRNINRPAIAMIELIFAIVIIGIVLMSAPMLMQQAAKSGYVTIQQEAINAAASRINMIMGYHWDEANTDESILDTILFTSSSVTDLNGTIRRIGTPQESYRSFIDHNGSSSTATAVASLGPDGSDEDDIDDFSGAAQDVNLTEIEASSADNIEKTTIKIATVVTYISDDSPAVYNSSTLSFSPDFTSSGSTTHIKGITTELTSTSGVDELNKTITLRAFSCNIGGYQLEERSFY